MLGLVLVALVSCDSADVSDPSVTEVDTPAAAALAAPGAVKDLRVISATSTTITVGWTAVSDGNGGAAKYTLRASVPPISWSKSYPTEIVIAAKPVGQLVTHTYKNAPPNTKAEFRVVSYRGELNTSTVVFGPLSNIAAGATLASDSTPTDPDPDPTPTPDTVVASVTASPASYSFTAIGATARVTAVAKNQAGTTLTNARFVWSTSNSGVVTVDATGLMTSRGAGSARVIVKSATSAAADTVPVTVTVTTTPPPTDGGNATYPNRPSGTTLIGRNNGTVKESGGHAFGIADFGNWYDHNVASDIAVVNDPTNPTGSGRSLRFTYPSNDDKAGSASARSFSGGPYRELYVMMRIYLEPSGWDTFGNKFFYIGAAGRTSGGPNQYYTDRGGSRIRLINQYAGSAVVLNSSDGPVPNPIQQGTWLNVEYHFVAESSPGAANGRMYIWVNGRLVDSNTSVTWARNSTLGFNGMEWYAEVNDIPRTSYYRLGELYIAGKK